VSLLETQPLARHDAPAPVAKRTVTFSGARIADIPPARAQMFLASLDEPVRRRIDLAIGAFQDDLQLIGVGVVAITARRATTFVAVHPARRRLGVGSDLLHAILDDATAGGVERLSGQPGSPVGRAFVAALRRRSSDATSRVPPGCHRRVVLRQ